MRHTHPDVLRDELAGLMARQPAPAGSYDVIVLGVGSMGAATCLELARRGHRVLGLERFGIPHGMGSHGGQSRIIRKAYYEHPDYVPLLEAAYRGWRRLEAETGERVYHATGLLYFGEPSHPLMAGMRLSAATYGVPVRSLSPSAQAERYPASGGVRGSRRAGCRLPDAGALHLPAGAAVDGAGCVYPFG